MQVFILLGSLSLLIGAVVCHNKPVDICSGADISDANRSDPDDFVERLWYLHFIVDPKHVIDLDSKVVYKYGSKGINPIAYQVGRNGRNGKCRTMLFQDSQTIRGRPCIAGKRLYPPSSGPAREYVQELSEDKTQLILYHCADYDRRRQRCKHNKVTAIGATTRKGILPGEKETFEAKLRQYGGIVPRIRVDRPEANDCEDSLLRALGLSDAIRPRHRNNSDRNNYV